MRAHPKWFIRAAALEPLRQYEVFVPEEAEEDPADACGDEDGVCDDEPHAFGAEEVFAFCVEESDVECVSDEENEADNEDGDDGEIDVEEISVPLGAFYVTEVFQVHGRLIR